MMKTISRLRIFISSVQKELAVVEKGLFLLRLFDVFLFDNAPAFSREEDEVHRGEMDAWDVHLACLAMNEVLRMWVPSAAACI